MNVLPRWAKPQIAHRSGVPSSQCHSKTHRRAKERAFRGQGLVWGCRRLGHAYFGSPFLG
jgi:hypothetical protein